MLFRMCENPRSDKLVSSRWILLRLGINGMDEASALTYSKEKVT